LIHVVAILKDQDAGVSIKDAFLEIKDAYAEINDAKTFNTQSLELSKAQN